MKTLLVLYLAINTLMGLTANQLFNIPTNNLQNALYPKQKVVASQPTSNRNNITPSATTGMTNQSVAAASKSSSSKSSSKSSSSKSSKSSNSASPINFSNDIQSSPIVSPEAANTLNQRALAATAITPQGSASLGTTNSPWRNYLDKGLDIAKYVVPGAYGLSQGLQGMNIDLTNMLGIPKAQAAEPGFADYTNQQAASDQYNAATGQQNLQNPLVKIRKLIFN